MNKTVLINFLSSKGVKFKVYSNRINLRCPVCGDSKINQNKKRLNIYFENDDITSIICFNCNFFSSKIEQFLNLYFGGDFKENNNENILNNEDVLKNIKNKLNTTLNSELSGFNVVKNNKIEIIKDFYNSEKENNYNDKFKPLFYYISKNLDLLDINIKFSKFDNLINCKDNEIIEYAKFRGIFDAPYITPENVYYEINNNKFLVFPFKYCNYVIMYQKRIVTGDLNNIPKYLTYNNNIKLFDGLDYIDTNFKYVFLVESVLDRIFIKNSLAITSSILSFHQKIILDYFFKDYKKVIMFDNYNIDNTAKNKIIKLLKNPEYDDYYFFQYPDYLNSYKDINEIYTSRSSKYYKLFNNKDFLVSQTKDKIKFKILLNII